MADEEDPGLTVIGAGAVWQGDCLTLLREVAPASVDMVLCDPPYGVTKNPLDMPLDLDALWLELRRVAKPRTAFVFTTQMPYSIELYNSNPAWFRYDLVWDKVLITGHLNARRAPLRVHEQVFVFAESAPVYNPQFTEGAPRHGEGNAAGQRTRHRNYGQATRSPDVYRGSTQKFPRSILRFARSHASKALHRTEKPVDLFEWLIRTYTDEGTLVLDPCCGSGTTAVAARRTGRRFLVMDKDPECIATTERRLGPDLPSRPGKIATALARAATDGVG